MRIQLTPEQISLYRDTGFLVIDNFLDNAELESWRSCTQEAVD
jgi:hypothetical protein